MSASSMWIHSGFQAFPCLFVLKYSHLSYSTFLVLTACVGLNVQLLFCSGSLILHAIELYSHWLLIELSGPLCLSLHICPVLILLQSSQSFWERQVQDRKVNYLCCVYPHIVQLNIMILLEISPIFALYLKRIMYALYQEAYSESYLIQCL